jgi:hypothetical protein
VNLAFSGVGVFGWASSRNGPGDALRARAAQLDKEEADFDECTTVMREPMTADKRALTIHHKKACMKGRFSAKWPVAKKTLLQRGKPGVLKMLPSAGKAGPWVAIFGTAEAVPFQNRPDTR